MFVLTLLTAALMSSSSFAQSNNVTTGSRPGIEAAQIPADMDVRLDGFLDDEAWALAQPITEFRQQEPVEGGGGFNKRWNGIWNIKTAIQSDG